jgi:hypothetical protein
MKERLNFQNPIGFNQKIQWLKIHDRNPVYTTLADKYLVKQHVGETIGKEYVVPLYGVFDSVDHIDYSLLPNRFVLKTTHSSSAVIICKDKSKLNFKRTNKQLRKWLKEEYFWYAREWAYKNIKPRIICEELLIDEAGRELKDYKFFCFNGKVKCFKIDFGRFIEHRANYFDVQGRLLPFGEVLCPPKFDMQLEMPYNLNKMIELSEKLSSEYPFVRVDFYNVNGDIYFGEMTFYPAGGLGKFQPDNYDELLGKWLQLPSASMQSNLGMNRN